MEDREKKFLTFAPVEEKQQFRVHLDLDVAILQKGYTQTPQYKRHFYYRNNTANIAHNFGRHLFYYFFISAYHTPGILSTLSV